MGASTFEIDFGPIGKRVDVAPGTDLLEAARQAGVGLASVCGGEGTCGRCRVVIMSGSVTPPVDADRRFISQLELISGQRLACRCQVYGDVKFTSPKPPSSPISVCNSTGRRANCGSIRPYAPLKLKCPPLPCTIRAPIWNA